MTLTQLIGNEKQNDENLLERAMNNKLINQIIKGEIQFKDMEYAKKGLHLFKKTENFFQSKERDLLCEFGGNEDLVNVDSNSMYAINNFLLGNKAEAEATLKKVEGRYDRNNTSFVSAHIMLAMAKTLIGNDKKKKQAKKLIEYIEKTFKYESYGIDKNNRFIELIKSSRYPAQPMVFIADSIEFSIARYFLGEKTESSIMLSDVNSQIYFEHNMSHLICSMPYKTINTNDKYKLVKTYPNALYVMLNYLHNTDFDRRMFLERIEYTIGRSYDDTSVKIYNDFGHEIGLFNNGYQDRAVSAKTNLVMCLTYLTLAGALDKYILK
jgi:hypothetical protein